MNNIFKRPTDNGGYWFCDDDANNILNTGIGLTTKSFANVPDDGWGTLISFVLIESHRIQIVYTWNLGNFYIRACYGENWTEWKQIGSSV